MQTEFPKRRGVRARFVNGTWGLEAVIMICYPCTDYILVGGSVCVCVCGGVLVGSDKFWGANASKCFMLSWFMAYNIWNQVLKCLHLIRNITSNWQYTINLFYIDILKCQLKTVNSYFVM